MKLCHKCGTKYPATEEHFYIQRSRRRGKPDTLQAHCKTCWKHVNAQNKLKIKLACIKKDYAA